MREAEEAEAMSIASFGLPPPTPSIFQLLTLYLGWDPIAMATRAYWLIGLL